MIMMSPTHKYPYVAFEISTGECHPFNTKRELYCFMLDKRFEDYLVYVLTLYLGPTKAEKRTPAAAK